MTLTLPSTQKHSDRYVLEKCLQPFIRTMRRKYRMHHYLWRAERQKNGNLHFHICLNQFIHHRQVRKHWNRLMRKHGYIDTAINADPPSTEIKSVKKEINLAAYIAKYIAKSSEDSQPITCKLWDCNEELKLFRFELVDIGHNTRTDEAIREICSHSRTVSMDFATLLIHDTPLHEQATNIGRDYREALARLQSNSGQELKYIVETFH